MGDWIEIQPDTADKSGAIFFRLPGQAEQRPVKGVETAGGVQDWAVPIGCYVSMMLN